MKRISILLFLIGGLLLCMPCFSQNTENIRMQNGKNNGGPNPKSLIAPILCYSFELRTISVRYSNGQHPYQFTVSDSVSDTLLYTGVANGEDTIFLIPSTVIPGSVLYFYCQDSVFWGIIPVDNSESISSSYYPQSCDYPK